jgi:flavin-binding protein dodecin
LHAESAISCALLWQNNQSGGQAMTMLKVIEILAESDKSWEDAAQTAVKSAAKSVRNVKSIYIKDFEATVDKAKIVKYRINAKISFVLGD